MSSRSHCPLWQGLVPGRHPSSSTPWDEPVPPLLAQKWFEWSGNLEDVHELRFDRCLIPAEFVDGSVELHHFCDASLVGYGECTYLRVVNRWGQIHVRLLVSKGYG